MASPRGDERRPAAHRRNAVIVAFFCGGLYLSLIVAALGLIALTTNTDVVAVREYSDLLGPVMIAASVIVLTAMLAFRAPRDDDEGLDWGYSILVALATGAAFVITGFVGATLELGLAAGTSFGVSTFFGGYDVAISVLAFGVSLGYFFVIARRYDENGRPRWTWEDDFDV